MRYINEIIINKNIDEVIRLFDNQENMYKWMDGLQAVEQISGTPGEPGAKAKLKFKIKNREFDMIETIRSKDLPQEMSGSYDMKGTINNIKVNFYDIGNNKTRYAAHSEIQFAGIGMKLFGLFMPGAFKKQSYKYMESFKNFAENT